ncbi:MBL fold metallo-hydrolase [Desulfopila sp. IMCC35006]|uniref:MBL fold metallo-hydrolase n=1 Tax=Desulfopila sp. IMCC35006 TaxID=2569542 RepID=UPI00197A704E|nr:MBL fold metallo-hydrolase [Desulfopila sp. IMCC35006]
MTMLTQHTISTPYMVGPVHCYTGSLAGELVLFDTGPPTREAQRYLAEHVDLASLKHIVITHCHVDHYGQAHWLEQNCPAALYFPYRDCLKIAGHDRRIEAMAHLLADLGFDDVYLAKLRQIFDSGVLFPPFPKKFLVAENDLPERLGIEVLSCPGHSQSDLVYVGDDWAVTGDTLLRGVFQSPLLDVDLEKGGRFKNYAAYCATVVKLAGLQGKTVLPSHRQTVKSIKGVLLFYISKFLQRAVQLSPYREEKNVMLLIDKVLKGRVLDTFQLYLKASEIVFMQDFLQQPELLRQALLEIGLFDDVTELFHSAVLG